VALTVSPLLAFRQIRDAKRKILLLFAACHSAVLSLILDRLMCLSLIQSNGALMIAVSAKEMMTGRYGGFCYLIFHVPLLPLGFDPQSALFR